MPTHITDNGRNAFKINRAQMLTQYRPKLTIKHLLKIKYNELVGRQLYWHSVVSICNNYPVL